MQTTRRTRTRARNAIPLLIAPLLFACTALPPAEVPSPNSAQGHLITRAEIEASGAQNGWQAIRRNIHHLRFTEDTEGDVTWIGAVRGRNSLSTADALLLVIDGTSMLESTYLQEIPARSIAYIQILSGLQGTARYGAAAGNGVIVIRTISPGQGVVQGT